MRPWHAINHYTGAKPREDFFIECFNDMKANDFTFATLPHRKDTLTLVFITPYDYWVNYTDFFNHSMPIIGLLPTDLVETYPSVYETKSSDRDIRNRLCLLDFVEDKWFQDFVEKRYSSYKE